MSIHILRALAPEELQGRIHQMIAPSARHVLLFSFVSLSIHICLHFSGCQGLGFRHLGASRARVGEDQIGPVGKSTLNQ